ncbi:MAG: chorismate mutase [Alphaproteobacteria bacterium]|nr:chorismate mutase [Alphaproteobacteria bacterium]MCY4496307.1 chorismate mutase [Rhodospirillaceae bacterium]
MSKEPNTLAALRREIDRIDTSIHDLLMRRSELVGRVDAVKKRGSSFPTGMRPGREAKVLRRLILRHRGALPAVVVARVWRELISAFTRLQGQLTVAVCAPEMSVGYWDLARSHFGSTTPMSLHRSPFVVMREVVRGEATVGVLPMPESDDEDPWWPLLAAETDNTLKIISRLPFVEDKSSRFEDLVALVVSKIPQDNTEDDRTLIVIAANAPISRASINELLRSAALIGRSVTALDRREDRPEWLHLVEVEGYLADDDPKIVALIEEGQGRIRRIVAIGGFANPIRTLSGVHPTATAAE